MQSARGIGNGDCGLSDGSQPGDWWLPNIRELVSLIQYGNLEDQVDPDLPVLALPGDHPFTNVQFGRYWSSTSLSNDTYWAWAHSVDMHDGDAPRWPKDQSIFVWPVRAGQ
jgi:hypothetical protein